MAVGDQHFPATSPIVYDGCYQDATCDTDQTATFISFDTDVNAGPHAINLRDEDHAAGMHYHIEVTSNSTGLVTVQRKSGSTKTLSGKFAGQTITAGTSVVVAQGDGALRIKPDGDNWDIY